jgi:predicted oxidoreductase
VTELEQLKAMLDRAGVVYTVKLENAGSTVTIIAKEGERNLGYVCFFTEWAFDLDGALLSVATWE